MTAAAIMRSGIHLRIWSPRTKPLDEMFDDILKNGGVQLVHDVLSVPLGQDQIGVLEYAQVPRDCRPAGGELLGDFARRSRPRAQKLEDLTPGWIRQGSKDVVHV